MRRVAQFTMRRQHVGHPAHFAAAHCIRLSSEAERSGTGLTDLARRQMQVDQRRILRRTRRRLIQSLAVQRQRRARSGKPLGRLHQVDDGDPAAVGNEAWRVVAQRILEIGKAVGVRSDVRVIEQAFPQHHMQHSVEQRDVGARQDLQEQVGGLGGRGAPRVDDDDLQIGTRRLCRLDPAEQHRVRPRGVRAGDEQAIGGVDVVVARRRRIGAQRLLVAGDRRRHAQPRIGVDVVGADQSLGQLVEGVIVFGEQLARHIERDAVGPMLFDGCGEARGEAVERVVPSRAQ